MQTFLHEWIVLGEGCGRVMRVEHVCGVCVGHVGAGGYIPEASAGTAYCECAYEKLTHLV